MKAPAFEYVRADSVRDVHEALATAHREDLNAKVLAGGQSLVPLMNFRLARPDRLVDINRLRDLSSHEVAHGRLRVGALCRHAAIEEDGRLLSSVGALADALPVIGHPAIRARGTVVGSLAHGDPLAEWLSLFLLFDGSVKLSRVGGDREVPVSDWLEGYLLTAAADDEFAEQAWLELPAGGEAEGTAFVEIAHRHGDFCLVSASASVSLGDRGAISSARVVVAGLGSVPFRATQVEERLRDEQPVTDAFERAVEALDTTAAGDDLHATAAYRRHAARVVATRALSIAAERAKEKAS